jgi:hypothetical protein
MSAKFMSATLLFCILSHSKRQSSPDRSDIFRLKNLSVWQIPVFCYGLLMRNQGYIEFETLEKTVLALITSAENIKTAINYFYNCFAHNLSIFLTGKLCLNIGICQTILLRDIQLTHVQCSEVQL